MTGPVAVMARGIEITNGADDKQPKNNVVSATTYDKRLKTALSDQKQYSSGGVHGGYPAVAVRRNETSRQIDAHRQVILESDSDVDEH